MKKIEQSILEVHRRIPVVRTFEEGTRNDIIKALPALQKKISVGDTQGTSSALQCEKKKSESSVIYVQAPIIAAKKTLNIPIGDVNTDQDYNKDVTPTFTLPPFYVKHIKKIGDEADVSLDYIIDIEDEVLLCTDWQF